MVTVEHVSPEVPPGGFACVDAEIVDDPAPLSALRNTAPDFTERTDFPSQAPVARNNESLADRVATNPIDSPFLQIPTWIGLTWLVGCIVMFARLSLAAFLLRRSERRCMVLHGRRDELQRVQSAVNEAKAALGLNRHVETLLDPQRSIPIVWGLLKTRLQLPSEALQWNDEQLRSVLLHELAHVRRRDLLVLALTQMACALHWFNPLVWIAAWRLHIERERACDDLILKCGVRASAYAEHLLNVATQLKPSHWTQACGLAMARNSSLHGRLAAVLDVSRNRRSLTKSIIFGSILFASVVAIPVAMLRSADESKQDEVDPTEADTTETAKQISPIAAEPARPALINSLGRGPERKSFKRIELPLIPRTGKLNPRDATRPLAERLSSDPKTRTLELIYLLRDFRVFSRTDEWAEITRELVQLGDVALPELIDELDRTERGQTLRALGFTLRAMENPRAVPALIRAIPKTLQPPSSDCGVNVHSQELFEFMAKHDNNPGMDDHISVGRPINEILPALERLTGHKFPEGKDSLRHVTLGEPDQQSEQRQLYLDRQKHWQDWWNEHGSEFLSQEDLAALAKTSATEKVGDREPDPIDRAGIERFGILFPTGPDVVLGPVREVELFSEDLADTPSTIDFDEHRVLRDFEVHSTDDAPNRLERSGGDIINRPKMHETDTYLWLIDPVKWQTLDQDVKNAEQIRPGTVPRGGFALLQPEQNTLLFLTREGGQGILQFDKFDDTRGSRKLRYRMWGDDGRAMTVGFDEFRKDPPAKWSGPVRFRLSAPKANALSGWSIKRNSAVPLPETIDVALLKGASFDLQKIPGLNEWREANDVSFVFVWADHQHTGDVLRGSDAEEQVVQKPSVLAFDAATVMVRPAAVTELKAQLASTIANEALKTRRHYPIVLGQFSRLNLSPQTHLFHLADGPIGILQVGNIDTENQQLECSYKILTQNVFVSVEPEKENVEERESPSVTVKRIPEPRDGLSMSGTMPGSKEGQALFRYCVDHARFNGNIPGGLIGLLRSKVLEFIELNEAGRTAGPSAKQMRSIIDRLKEDNDWSPREVVALFDDIANIHPVPLERTLARIRSAMVGSGFQLPGSLNDLNWGEPSEHGLRMAWMLEPRANEYPLGTLIKSRLFLDNSGDESVAFVTRVFHQPVHSATTAAGTVVPMDFRNFDHHSSGVAVRLDPGEYCELSAPGLGIGPRSDHQEDWANVDPQSWILAKEGDQIEFHPGTISLGGSRGVFEIATRNGIDVKFRHDNPDETIDSTWWLKFISERLQHETPIPDEKAERKAILSRVIQDLFGNSPTAEEVDLFQSDLSPEAVPRLAERLAKRSGLAFVTGTIQGGMTTFRVVPDNPEATSRIRVVTSPGRYRLGEKVGLLVKHRLFRSPDSDGAMNEASIIFYPDCPKGLNSRSHPVLLSNNEEPWTAAWLAGSSTLWVQQGDIVRNYDFTDPENITEESVETENLPAAIRHAAH